VLDGVPSGVAVTTADIAAALARRRLGYGRGARMTFEQDEVELTGGVRHGRTMGGPVAIRVANTEWPKWETVMSADPVDADFLAEQARNAPLTRPRPGHADLAGMQKYDVDDARPVLERASARETAARVALGTVVRGFLRQCAGVEVVSHVVSIGPVAAPDGVFPGPADAQHIDASPVRCLDDATSQEMVAEIDRTRRDGDTLGGVVEVLAYGLPPGLGSFTSGDRRLDARLAGALMGIQAIKGVEVGDGFTLAGLRGSQAHDEIVNDAGALRRVTGRSGGTEGGMSTGEVLRVRAAMKPISTVPRALRTIDTATGDAAVAINQRSDVCAVPAAGVVAEAMVALVLAEALLEKFGGDSLGETRRNLAGYLARIRARRRSGRDEPARRRRRHARCRQDHDRAAAGQDPRRRVRRLGRPRRRGHRTQRRGTVLGRRERLPPGRVRCRTGGAAHVRRRARARRRGVDRGRGPRSGA
jgi:chorismate synthase